MKSLGIFDVIEAVSRPRSLYIAMLVILVLAYGAEVGSYTFNTDHYWELSFRESLTMSWMTDGRYLAEFLRWIMGGYYPPSLTLILGLLLLVVSCAIISKTMGLPPCASIIFSAIVCVFPFFFETFSYHALRLFVPLAIFLATIGLSIRGVIGALLLAAAAAIYQSSIYFASTTVLLFFAIQLVNKDDFKTAFFRFLSSISLIFVGVVLYGITLLAVRYFFPSPDRLSMFGGVILSYRDFAFTFLANAKSLGSVFIDDAFLFPPIARISMMIAIVYSAAMICYKALRNEISYYGAIMIIILLFLLPASAHGATWLIKNPDAALFQRVLFAYSMVCAGYFSISYSVSGERGRIFVCSLFAVCVAAFIWQANVWHQFMSMKNRADFDIASAIYDDMRRVAGFEDGLPVVVVGTLDASNYLPFRAFSIKRSTIDSTILDSAFELDWAKERPLMFFSPMRWPDEREREIGITAAKSMPVWPEPGSIRVESGVVAVVLSHN